MDNSIDRLFDDESFSLTPEPSPPVVPILLPAASPLFPIPVPVMQPQSQTSSMGTTATDVIPPKRSRRGRKPMFANLPEPQRLALTRAVRSEKNRRCARESRYRKQNYIRTLEDEINTLKAELADCKSKLARYELIEQQRDLTDAEDQHVFEAAKREMQQTKATSRQFPDIFMRKMTEKLAVRQKALQQLARIAVEIAVPLSLRVFLRVAEDTSNMNRQEGLDHVLGCRPTGEDARNIIQAYDDAFSDPTSCLTLKERSRMTLERLRGHVKQLLQSHRGIQEETWMIWKYMTEDFVPKKIRGKVEESAIFHLKLRDKPELGDYTLFQVNDNDFVFESPGAWSESICDADIIGKEEEEEKAKVRKD